MRKFLTFLIITVLFVSALGCSDQKEKQESIQVADGVYLTDTAYGMEDFISKLTVEGNILSVYIEHYAVPVEEYSGTFVTEGNKILFTGEDNEMEFEYNPEEQTIYNDTMETTWVIEEKFVPSKEGK